MAGWQRTSKHLKLWLLLASLLGAVWSARTLFAQYPSGLLIEKDETKVLLVDYASLPLSSTTTTPNMSGQLARVNFMRSEPAPSSASRFFVSDSNRNLYILSKAEPRSFTTYLNFEAIFPKFDNAPGYSGGLVTLAFAPDYATSGIFYTVHLEDPTLSGTAVPTNATTLGLNLTGYATTPSINPPAGTVVRHAVLVEWRDTNITNTTFQGTAQEVLRIGFGATIHPLGDIIFNPNVSSPDDPDYGNLYVAVGDGASGETAGSTHTIPQRLDALQGKILRITPDINLRTTDLLSANGRYRVPSTPGSDPNPFVSLTLPNLKPEIFAYGFRNPHRLSWDTTTSTSTFIVNDIGLNAWEEVNIVIKGGNYGYGEREGTEQLVVLGTVGSKTGSQTSPVTPFPGNDTLVVAGLPDPVTPIYPALSYSHNEGDAMSSGFVYRGTLMPHLVGKYIFGDITTGRIFYSELGYMLSSTRTIQAPIHEIQVVYSSPYNSLGPINRRVYDVVADAYEAKGGDSLSVLPGRETVVGGSGTPGRLDIGGVQYGGGRADIRLVEDSDREVYLLSKSDGMIRSMTSVPAPVEEAPTITGHPQGTTVTVGGTAIFTVSADGTAPLAYEWRRGGSTIPGSLPTLTLSNVQTTDAGSYDVVVSNAFGVATSNAATLVVNPLPPVPPPSGLTATGGNLQAALSWTGVSGATGYRVKRSTTNGGPYTAVATVTGASYTNTGLTNGTTYYYVVTALMGTRESVNSNQAFATPVAPVLPSPWQTRDIGGVAAAGNASFANGVFTVTGSGEDIYGTLDEFRYVYQPASGNCEIKVRVASVQNVDPWAESGLLIRETLNSNSKKVASLVTVANGVTFQRRSTTGGLTYYSRVAGVAAPYWIRLVRSGNTFTAYRSSNNTTWTSMGSITVTMGTDVYIGLAVTAHRDGALNTSTFDNVTVVP